MSDPRMNRHKTRREQGDVSTRSGASTGHGGISVALGNFFTLHAQAFIATLGQLSRRPFATLMTVAVIGIALALPAGLYVLLNNAQHMVSGWEGASQISLFLKSGISEARAQQLAGQLRQRPEIATTDYISRDDALEEFRRLSGFGEALGALTENPLPSVLVVRLKREVTEPARIENLLDDLRGHAEVDIAQLDMQWVRRLHAVMAMVERGVLVLASLLGLAVLLVVGNTIRLAIQSRRDEIVITKLIGATDAFIRRPFLYSGAWYGIGGGLLALLLVQLSLFILKQPVHNLALLYSSSFAMHGLGLATSALLLGSGAMLGLLGSWLAVGRHLKDIEPN
ncbi:MAG TPA: permease-like cell division protein FtsX [Gammaproteobacteria bacterium]